MIQFQTTASRVGLAQETPSGPSNAEDYGTTPGSGSPLIAELSENLDVSSPLSPTHFSDISIGDENEIYESPRLLNNQDQEEDDDNDIVEVYSTNIVADFAATTKTVPPNRKQQLHANNSENCLVPLPKIPCRGVNANDAPHDDDDDVIFIEENQINDVTNQGQSTRRKSSKFADQTNFSDDDGNFLTSLFDYPDENFSNGQQNGSQRLSVLELQHFSDNLAAMQHCLDCKKEIDQNLTEIFEHVRTEIERYLQCKVSNELNQMNSCQEKFCEIPQEKLMCEWFKSKLLTQYQEQVLNKIRDLFEAWKMKFESVV